MNKLKSWIISGILVSLPLVLTFYIISGVINFFDNLILNNSISQKFIILDVLTKIPGSGLIITALSMLLIGFITTNFLGKYFLYLTEKLLNKIPLVRTIYSTFKQIFETILSQKSNSFKEVVLIEYPRKDCWTLAFITSETKGEIQNKTTSDVVSIFVPTTPNPTSGFLLFVPKSDVIHLDMKPEIAMKLIVSGGVIGSPEDVKQLEKKSK